MNRAAIGRDYAVLTVGQRVTVADPWGPSGPAVVVELQETPHHAVLVRIDGATSDQWLLGPYVTPVKLPGCVCTRHTDGSVTHSMCPLHAEQDPCLTMAQVTGRRRTGTIRRGVCTACGHDARAVSA